MSLAERLGRWALETGNTRPLAVARVAFGVLLLLQTLEEATALERVGYFGDAFHLPFVPEALVPSRDVYGALLALRAVLAALVIAGRFARPALLASALLGLHVLLCDRVGWHHNRYALACFSFLIAFAPCDPPVRVAPLWAQRVAQLQLSIIYLASGGSKLLDADWRGGLVLGDRFARYGGEAIARGVPPALVEALSRPLATSALSKAAIATELFLAVGLWLPRTRVFALWCGVMFHSTIEATSKVELFTWVTFAGYLLFATPDVRARRLLVDPSRAGARFVARAVVLLDWLARFEVRPEPAAAGAAITVVQRDGSRATGLSAAVALTRTLPLLFPLWGPFSLAERVARRRR